MVLSNYLPDNEKVIYKCEKKLWIVIAYICFLILFLIVFGIASKEIVSYYTEGNVIFDMVSDYSLMLITAIFIVILISAGVSYIFDIFLITNNYIVIRRGILGEICLIKRKQIVAKREIVITEKVAKCYKVEFLLKNGKIINSGDLHCNSSTYYDLNGKLNYPKVENKKDFLNFKINSDNNVLVKKNLNFSIIGYGVYLILMIFSLLLFSGINEKYGEQKKFELHGISNKYTGYNKGTIYYISILEDQSQKEYNIHVSGDIYDSITPNKKIKVTGKTGCLGIVYDLKMVNID